MSCSILDSDDELELWADDATEDATEFLDNTEFDDTELGADDELKEVVFVTTEEDTELPTDDVGTLDAEYKRDLEKGLPIQIPINYYKDNDPSKEPVLKWRSSATLLFTNWLNYYVYQSTPFDISLLNDIKHDKKSHKELTGGLDDWFWNSDNSW